jgi:hypothetical protein
MKILALPTSQRLLLPATLLLGVLIGMGIAGSIAITYYEKVLASNRADQAVVLADTVAEIDDSDPVKAREIARGRLHMLIGQLTTTMKPSQAREHARYLKKISTYLDASPGINLSAPETRFLAAFPPLKGKDLEATRCDFGVCRLAKDKLAKAQASP